jgi:hypothetical protein
MRALRSTVPHAAAATLVIAALAGCGGDDGGADKPVAVPKGDSSPVTGEFKRALTLAAEPKAGQFPPTGGRTLREFADTLDGQVKMGQATSVLTEGDNRFAFGLIDDANRLIYAPTALYVADSPQDKARGPYLAPASSLVVDPPFRSSDSAKESDAIAAIYAARVPLRAPRAAIVAVTATQGRHYGAAVAVEVERKSPVAEVGGRAPNVETDTRATVGGNQNLLCTRKPIDDMHSKSLKEVYGKKPVALLFATPALCESRVCGPVVDIAQQLKREYGDRVEFIHQEVFVDNQHGGDLRAPLKAYGLETEPWLFTLDRSGRVAARLEGSFGIEEFRDALESAL